MIKCIGDVQELVRVGFQDWSSLGHVKVIEKDGLLLFNYDRKAVYENEWNVFERISRGLIIQKTTGVIVARPFDKFWNYGESGRLPKGNPSLILEKIDGSLGILYRDGNNLKIATRGSFDGEQAVWATEFLNKHYNLSYLPSYLTLLFEIVYPGDRHIVNYGELEDLVLIGARNRFTGQYVPYSSEDEDALDLVSLQSMFGFTLVGCRYFGYLGHEQTTFEDIQSECEKLGIDQEGFVILDQEGNRWKLKGKSYLELKKIAEKSSVNGIVEALEAGQDQELADACERSPDLAQRVKFIKSMVQGISHAVEIIFNLAPKESRKEFATWVMVQTPEWSDLLFARLDNKPLLPFIYKNIKKRSKSLEEGKDWTQYPLTNGRFKVFIHSL